MLSLSKKKRMRSPRRMEGEEAKAEDPHLAYPRLDCFFGLAVALARGLRGWAHRKRGQTGEPPHRIVRRSINRSTTAVARYTIEGWMRTLKRLCCTAGSRASLPLCGAQHEAKGERGEARGKRAMIVINYCRFDFGHLASSAAVKSRKDPFFERTAGF